MIPSIQLLIAELKSIGDDFKGPHLPRRVALTKSNDDSSNWGNVFIPEDIQNKILQLVDSTKNVRLVSKSWYNTSALIRQTTSPVSGRDLVLSYPLVDFMRMTSDVLLNPQSFFHPDDKEVAANIAMDILTHEKNRGVVKLAIQRGEWDFLLFLIDAYNKNRSFFDKLRLAFDKNLGASNAIQYIEDWTNPSKR
jgi:hypothetical protein